MWRYVRRRSGSRAIHLSPVSLENDFPRYRVSRGAVRPISQPAGLRGQPATEKRVALGGGDDDAGADDAGGGGGGGDVEPPAPVITSGGPLLPTRTTPSFYVPDGRAHIRGVSG